MSDVCLTRDAALAANDAPPNERVDLPEWGGHVFVRMLPLGPRGQWEDECFDTVTGKPRINTRMMEAKIVVLATCDDSGGLLFSDRDISALCEKSADVVERIALAAMSLNGLSVGDVEDEVKNSPGAQSDSSDTS